MDKRPTTDTKTRELTEQGCLNPAPQRVNDPLFAQDPFFDSRDIIQVKYEMLRRARIDGMSVTAAAGAHGMSRPAFYQALHAFEQQGLWGLVPRKRGPRQGHKLTDEVVAFMRQVLSEQGPMSSTVLAERVQERFGVTVHCRSIERAVARGKKKHR